MDSAQWSNIDFAVHKNISVQEIFQYLDDFPAGATVFSRTPYHPQFRCLEIKE